MKTDRVSLRADDAVFAMTELRFAIESEDERIAKYLPDPDGDDEYYSDLLRWREEKWQAYNRIAKALGLNPTLSTINSGSTAEG